MKRIEAPRLRRIHPPPLARPFSKGLHARDNFTSGIFTVVRITVNMCPLGEGGSPKGRGWIRLEEAGSPSKRKI